MKRRIQFFCAFNAMLMGFGMSNLRAQATASIIGTVTDSSGAVIAEAVVRATNEGTAIVRGTVSDTEGRFRIPDLPIGSYSVETQKPGFETVIHKAVTLTVGSVPVVDFALPVGQTQQTVAVSAEVSQVETDNSAISNLVGETQMRELPLNGRDYYQLLTLAPGVTAYNYGASGALFGNQQNYSVSGGRAQGMLYLLDDTDTSGYWKHGGGSGALGTSLGVDAIAEFQTLTNTYSAEFGGEGAVINASTKSGTNTYHGSVYEFIRNSAIESRNFFDGASPPPYRQNQFGATAGGPIKKNKAFFFVNYEGFRASKTVSTVNTVPDAEAHDYMMPNGNGVYVPVTPNSNPATAAAVQAVLNLYPVATTEIYKNGLPTGTGFITQPNNTLSYENYLVERFDYTLSDKDTFFARDVLDRASKRTDSPIPIDPEEDLTRNNYATVEERHIFSPTLVNIAYASYVRNAEFGDSPAVNPALQWFPGEGRPDGKVTPGSSLTAIGINAGTLPFYLIPNDFGEGDNVIWTHGAHSMKFGFSTIRLQENTYGPSSVGGSWSFPNLTSFLEGIPTSFSGQLADYQYPSDAHKDWREREYGMYVQDDWKVSRTLTANLGFRYEPAANASWANHLSLNIIDAPYGNWVPVKNVHATNISLKNVEPRVGLAWDPFADHKTSIRAGFGMFNDVITGSQTTMYLQPPFLTGTQTLAQGAVFPTPLTDIPPGSGTIATNGSVTCSPCTYFGQTRTPTIFQYNLSFQREIMPSTVATVVLVGSHGIFLQAEHDFNSPVPVVGADGNLVFGSLINGNIVANPRLNPTWGTMNMWDGDSSSHYWGLQSSLERRLSKGFQAQLSYTWSKSIDDNSGSVIGGTIFTNPANLRSDFGLSNFDSRNNLRLSTVYQLPFHSGNSFVNFMTSGWQWSVILTYLSGFPFSPSVGFASVGTSTYTPRPNVIAGCNLYPSNQTLSDWFNTSCYTAPPIGEFGNAGRDTLIGPDTFDVDSSFSKEAKMARLGEQFTIQFRAEFFNILNHPSFAAPNANLWVQGTNGAFNPNPSVNLITATTSQPRQIQFALKVIF